MPKTMTCKSCGKHEDLRLGHCWGCAEAQSIIEEGLDMYDKGLDGKDGEPAMTSMQKVTLLHQKGLLK